MRRTLALALAVPVAILLGASPVDQAARVDGAPAGTATLQSPSVVGDAATAPSPAVTPPATAPAPEPPTGGAPDASRPVTDGPAATGSGAPDAEGTLDEDGRSSGEGSSSVADPASPLRPATDGPVEDTFLIASAPAAGAVAGSGPRWRYTIEVDPGLGVDPDVVAVAVRAALTDERSWVRTRTLEQVDDPGRARIRVVLAAPDVVDELCGRVGLRTAGIYSCWNGRFAALNSWRWEVGADGFTDITTYRNYLVNHEFGHGLGYGHVGCPGPGEPAPVMMQQSKGVGECVANGWPYP